MVLRRLRAGHLGEGNREQEQRGDGVVRHGVLVDGVLVRVVGLPQEDDDNDSVLEYTLKPTNRDAGTCTRY